MARQIKTLSPTALEFMAWELTDVDERDPETQTQWCEAHGVPQNSPARWKRSDAWSIALEKAATTELADDEITNERIEGVIAVLHAAALQGDVSAATAYMKHAAMLETPDDEDVRGMTNIELAVALEAAAVEARALGEG